MFNTNEREKAQAHWHCFVKTNKSSAIELRYFQSFTAKVFIKAIFILLPVFALANRPPKVEAGPAIRVVYPSTASATLLGSGSDFNGPVTFQWKQLSGNTRSRIAQPTSAITTVTNLRPGLYTYSLTVTDTDGLSRSDTTTISVLQKMTWTVSGILREALVHPATGGTGPAPIIFAFHGHGGTDSGYAEKGFELNWPEAIVVYPQGLRTKTPVDSNCHEAGWQGLLGEVNCRNGIVNQDLKFFDVMLSKLERKYSIDSSLVFVHGWSNGADFIYNVLWAARRNKIAGLAPAGGNMDTIIGKQPIPVIHTAGTLDERVAFTDQQQDVQAVRNLDKCSTTGTVWATGPSGLLGMRYASPLNAPVVFLQYNGPHSFPFTVPALMVKFFKEVAASKKAALAQPLITRISPPANKSIFVR